VADRSAAVALIRPTEDSGDELLDRVFFALSDPVRRAILERLDGRALLVSELAAPFRISLQAVSRHIQVLVRAGLIEQERTGRISRCSLLTGPVHAAAVWINRYSKYWQQQFDTLAVVLEDIEARDRKVGRGARRKTKGSARRARQAKSKSREE
jgi:DNA-binding transcriptional ArsR family regulator